MPVVWNTASCNPPTPKDDRDMHWRSCIINVSGAVGLSKVSEDNVEEWLWRVEFLRRLWGDKNWGCLVYADKSQPDGHRRELLTPAVLRRWSGLWTNWSNFTRPAFVKQYVSNLEDQTTRRVQAQMEGSPAAKPKPKRKRRVKA